MSIKHNKKGLARILDEKAENDFTISIIAKKRCLYIIVPKPRVKKRLF